MASKPQSAAAPPVMLPLMLASAPQAHEGPGLPAKTRNSMAACRSAPGFMLCCLCPPDLSLLNDPLPRSARPTNPPAPPGLQGHTKFGTSTSHTILDTPCPSLHAPQTRPRCLACRITPNLAPQQPTPNLAPLQTTRRAIQGSQRHAPQPLPHPDSAVGAHLASPHWKHS